MGAWWKDHDFFILFFFQALHYFVVVVAKMLKFCFIILKLYADI